MPGTDYSSYLRIDDLLQLQQPLSAGAPDELLFIVVHQAYELWFKLVLHELELARSSLLDAEPWAAAPRLRRAVAVEELLLHQLGVLETMSPEGFLEFRDPLAPASGFQSTQFREIEAVSAGTSPEHAESPLRSEEQRETLRRRATEPTLWDALCEALGRHGLVVDAGDSRAVEDAIASVYREHAGPVRAAFHQVFELMVDHDEAIARWRYRHALMAAREIGRRTGTGGSLGVGYLDTTLEQRFFPVLWQVRSVL
jgi:tryptophan 2,3-dioxygenase